ncbi:hypothetical protein [Staphylococcus argenteus]|uniref:hypothetical protein n=1 Tax=Staphylococcus argenteus TaxID=985002 RepID=UPI002862E507|nr:hypothetical protein [Staphylococcus argenteus]MDR7647327.1 hypothetical protein [Staphylococcus argenteus]
MKLAKLLTISFIVWLAISLIDFLYELFKITQSQTIITLMGLKIQMSMTKDEIMTYFSLNPKMLVSFITVFVIVTVIMLFFSKHNKVTEKQ